MLLQLKPFIPEILVAVAVLLSVFIFIRGRTRPKRPPTEQIPSGSQYPALKPEEPVPAWLAGSGKKDVPAWMAGSQPSTPAIPMTPHLAPVPTPAAPAPPWLSEGQPASKPVASQPSVSPVSKPGPAVGGGTVVLPVFLGSEDEAPPGAPDFDLPMVPVGGAPDFQLPMVPSYAPAEPPENPNQTLVNFPQGNEPRAPLTSPPAPAPPPMPTNSSGPGRKARLTVIDGPDKGKYVEFQSSLTVGRASTNQLSLSEDRSTSSHHALIEWRDRGYVVIDLGSTNGTRVNNHRVTEAMLNPGDWLILGRNLIRITPS